MKESCKNTDHIINAQSDRRDFEVSMDDMLLDLKVLLKEYYCGTFTNDKNSIKISLNNGQKFLLNLTTV